MIKRKSKTVSSEIEKPNEELPITHCPVFVRIQPILSNLPGLSRSEESSEIGGGGGIRPIGVNVVDEKHLFFLILLRDVNNSLDHATLTQSLPAVWLDIPFEENEVCGRLTSLYLILTKEAVPQVASGRFCLVDSCILLMTLVCLRLLFFFFSDIVG